MHSARQGEDGDPDRLAQLARRWNSVYEGFLDWASSLRRFNAPAELRNLLELAARYADEPLEKYRQFVEEYAAQVDEFPARVAAGEPLIIEGSIVLVGSKDIVQAYMDELSRLQDDVKVQAQVDQPEGRRSSGDHESGSAESPPASDDNWVGLPPSALTENDHILVWWLPDYDEAIREVVAEYQWAWQIPMLERLETLIPESVLRAWRDADPFCQEYSWQNVLLAFAWGRAVQLGICSRPALQKECSCCSREFLESDLSHRAISRLGADTLDVCERCLRQAFYARASAKATPGVIIAVLQALSGVLGRPVRSGDINGKLDLRGLSRDARGAAVRALRVRPTLARVTELFGSWEAAVAQAAAAAPVPLPRYDIAKPLLPADSEFTSGSPADYRSLMGPPVEVFPDSSRDPQAYREEISSLIGAGYLALAEAALVKLCARHDMFHDLLARVYGQTAREGQALDAIEAFSYRLSDRERDGARAHLLTRRDIRTIVAGPAFYEPLASLPRGNVRFVLIGGPMEYVDRRGVHACVTGEDPSGSSEAGRAESVARMGAMVDGVPWMRAAAETGQAILKSLSRAGAVPGLYGHQLSYVTSPFRQIVKELTGSVPKKVAEDAWALAPPGKSGWSYQREAAHYLFNAAAGFRYLPVQAAPAVCIWGWPDRSDGCLQAFLDTVAGDAADPVTVILPDVPAFRNFARRYVRMEPMTSCGRTLIEDHLYRMPLDMPNKRGTILSAEFAPRLVVHPDGSEDDGLLLTGALAYLDARHTLRLSVWDLLRDALLRAVAMTAPTAPGPFSLSASDRTDMVSWYGRNTEYDEPDVLRPYRPTLLDAAIPAQASLTQ